jgi:cellulose synthase/poly-beta-1,6-N-acetylglucosamine synthase-like glycosyltransferase
VGRNAAIRAASGEIICSTDAGVRLDASWLEELTRAFAASGADSLAGSRSPRVDVVAGFFVPDPQGIFETALAATTLPALRDIRPATFLPSSRSIAFRKSAWEAVGDYPEWLDYCEDLIFDLALRSRGSAFAFEPHAVVHFRPRGSLRAFFKQYYRYARGDGKANLWLKRHIARYLTYFVALPLLLALTITVPQVSLVVWLAAAAFMFYTPYRRLFPMLRGLSLLDQVTASAWVPAIRVTGDLAKMIGYPVGVAWRLRFRKQGSGRRPARMKPA